MSATLLHDGWERVSRRTPCPRCGKPDWCLLHRLRGIGVCCRIESAHFWDRLAGWAYRLDGGDLGPDWRELLPAAPPAEPRPASTAIADPPTRHLAYTAFLAALDLSDVHRANLQARGFTDAQITYGGYRTLPDDRAVHARALAAMAEAIGRRPADLIGFLPGVIRRPTGEPGLQARAGLLVPVRTMPRTIAHLKVRLDHADAGGKYVALSGGADQGGISIDGTTIHIALPQRPHPGPHRRLVIVEGELNADLSAHRLGVPVLALPGVGVQSRLLETIAAFGRPGELDLALALDADAATNPAVAQHKRRALRTLLAAGYRVADWQWNGADGNGLDDLLNAGLLPFPTIPDLAAADPLAEPAPTPINADAARDLARLRRHQQATVATIANPNLGGDIGGKVAVLVAGELAYQHGGHPMGEWFPVSGGRVGDGEARVASSTVASYLKKWGDAGLIEVQQRPERVVDARGIMRPVLKNYVRFDGDATRWLERMAVASVFADPTDRPVRGGSGPKRPKRPTCPDCGGELQGYCPACGALHDLAAVDADRGCTREAIDRAAEPDASGIRPVSTDSEGVPLADASAERRAQAAADLRRRGAAASLVEKHADRGSASPVPNDEIRSATNEPRDVGPLAARLRRLRHPASEASA